MYKRFFKRFIDIVLSFTGIMVLILPLIVISIAIKLDSKGPVLFKQRRVGRKKNGEITYFNIWKFRTMKIDTPKDMPTHLLESPYKYITKVGRLLRKTSLDELPQLFNILVGHMSIVGPRPALWNQEDLVEEREKYGVNDVRPGLTGWAQINGRDQLPVPVKAKFDGEYVEKLSFAFDAKCFFGTVSYIFRTNEVVEGKVDEEDTDNRC